MINQAEAVANGTVTCVMCENKRVSKSLQADLSLVINAANAEKSRITSMHFQVLCALNALTLYKIKFSLNSCAWGGRRVPGYLCG